MDKSKQVGKYDIEFANLSWDGDVPYQRIFIHEFDGDKEIRRKILYFMQDVGAERVYIMPKFRNEDEVEMWLQYRNNAKIKIYNKIVVEEV